MNTINYDKAELTAVSPKALSAYAGASGWERTDKYGDSSYIYTAPNLPEVILPESQNLADYARVVLQLIRVFAEVAEKSEHSVYKELIMFDSDAIRVQVPASDDGTISIDRGLKLVKSLKPLLLSAAYSLQNPKLVYHRAPNNEATKILKRVRLGPTEQGSFVFCLFIPLTKHPVQQQVIDPNWVDPDPIERRFTKHLAKALNNVPRIMEERNNGDSKALENAVSVGVSANLCESLSALVNPFQKTQISFTWARSCPRKESSESFFSFDKEDAPTLTKTAELFREREQMLNLPINGFVKQLTRDQNHRTGTITLRAQINGSEQLVRAELNPEDYKKAIQAHLHEARLEITGDLKWINKQRRLQNARTIDVVPSTELTQRESHRTENRELSL